MKVNNIPKIKNMTSTHGNDIPNQFIITTNDGTFFQSYDSIIAFQAISGKTVLDINMWDFSKTTGKYRNKFLEESKADTRRKIASGEYIMADLN